jgi:hypothetical protein
VRRGARCRHEHCQRTNRPRRLPALVSSYCIPQLFLVLTKFLLRSAVLADGVYPGPLLALDKVRSLYAQRCGYGADGQILDRATTSRSTSSTSSTIAACFKERPLYVS